MEVRGAAPVGVQVRAPKNAKLEEIIYIKSFPIKWESDPGVRVNDVFISLAKKKKTDAFISQI